MLERMQVKHRTSGKSLFAEATGSGWKVTADFVVNDEVTKVFGFLHHEVNAVIWNNYSIGAANLEEFTKRHEDVRHELMLRKLLGNPLTPVENVALQFLNKRLEELLPVSSPKGYQDVLAASERADQLLKLVSGGNSKP